VGEYPVYPPKATPGFGDKAVIPPLIYTGEFPTY